MINKKIAVECLTNEQKTEAIKYGREEAGLSPYIADDGTGKYIIVSSDEGKCILGTHDSGAYTSNKNYSIISYDEFERDYLKKEEHPIIGECYTVTDTLYPGRLMIGRVISVDETSSDGNIIGIADYISIFSQNSLNIHRSWCYKDRSNRTFRKSTPEEIQWLDACIKTGRFIPKEEALKPKTMKWNFEVGKYYYFEAYDSKQPTYVKVSKIDDSGVAGEYYIYLTGKDTGNYYVGKGGWNLSDVNNPKEVTLSEILPYLPEGHSDKIPVLLTPEEGKWYKVKVKEKERIWLFKSEKRRGTETP